MGTNLEWHKSRYPGVRYRLHPTRKHGVGADRYFVVRYQFDGKRREEALGWSSEGMTESKAFAELTRLKAAARSGEGPVRLAEKRALAEAKRQAEEQAQADADRDSLTFGALFQDVYLPSAKAHKKEDSWGKEEWLHRKYLAPVIGDKRMGDVSPFDLERVQKNMRAADLAPKTVMYALATVRQVFNFARARNLFSGDNPVSKIKKPKFDNRRMRFLSPEEAGVLLEALSQRSQQTYEMALVSLHCGLRFSEIAGLAWGDLDFGRNLILIKDAKNSLCRSAVMTDTARQTLMAKPQGSPAQLVFPGRGGKRQTQVSRTFDRTVEVLGLNHGINDPRQKVVFHTLRHSFAANLVENSTHISVVKEMLGHKTLVMTSRYVHVGDTAMQEAARKLNEKLPRPLRGLK